MKNSIKTLVAIVMSMLAIPLFAQTPPSRYVEGQVWEYKTRPQDAGSLLKIQKVEVSGSGNIYHISVIGVNLSNPNIAGVLPHIPVSDVTLDASVTRLATTSASFPDSQLREGIEEWRRAEGGVFTIPMMTIVEIVDQQLRVAWKPAPDGGAIQ